MTLGALALAFTLADTIRLFLKAGNFTAPSLIAWGLWTPALVAPLAWAVRDRPRAASYVALGYGTAILALGVIEVCLAR